MIIVISPAKRQDFAKCYAHQGQARSPLNVEAVLPLLQHLRALPVEALQQLLGVGETLASSSYHHYQDWQLDAHEVPALVAYQGDVYQWMCREEWPSQAWQFADRHLLILSALYGPLPAMSAIMPYRLEMKHTLQGFVPLADYWRQQVANCLRQAVEDSQSNMVLNLASKEYAKALSPLSVPTVELVFQERLPDGRLRVVAVNAKRARGAMAGAIIQQGMRSLEQLFTLTPHGYTFSEEHSHATRLCYIKG